MAKENKRCQLFYQVPSHAWHPGFISGQESMWTAHDSMLTVNRSGNYPESGNPTIATGGKRVSPSFMVSNNFEQTWKQFEKHGCLVSTSKTFGNGFHGDEAVNVTVEPGIERTLGFGAVLSRQRFQRYALRINNYRSTLYLKRTIRKKS